MESKTPSQTSKDQVPLVSVCIPTFQHKGYIAQCLESVLAQKTDFPFEILVGEDDSTDGTREICQDFANRYPTQIRLFLRKSEDKIIRNGKKVGRANHLALYRDARGEFLCICDGDDYWIDEGKLQYQLDLLKQYPSASICITKSWIEGNKEPISQDIPDQITLLPRSKLDDVLYRGHISSWMLRNNMEDFLLNPASIHCPGLDNVLFNFYKMKGDVLLCPKLTSFYRKNPNGSYRRLSAKAVQKKRIRSTWLMFIYLHKNPVIFARHMAYMIKRYIVNY